MIINSERRVEKGSSSRIVCKQRINKNIQEAKKGKGEKERLCVYSKVYVRVKEGQRRMERKKISLL